MFNPNNLDEDGHEESKCWKLHPKLRPEQFQKKGKGQTTTIVQHDLESGSGDETKITTMGHKGNLSEASTSSCNHVSNSNINHNVKERDALFHIRIIAKHAKMDTLFNSGSQVNLISE
ncbi:unnamed protein product, partial [Adineta steineri]